jgi:hypothetical protein
VKHVGLQPPVLQKRAEGEVELEVCHVMLPRSRRTGCPPQLWAFCLLLSLPLSRAHTPY